MNRERAFQLADRHGLISSDGESARDTRVIDAILAGAAEATANHPDKARLDWLEQNLPVYICHVRESECIGNVVEVAPVNGQPRTGKTIRNALPDTPAIAIPCPPADSTPKGNE